MSASAPPYPARHRRSRSRRSLLNPLTCRFRRPRAILAVLALLASLLAAVTFTVGLTAGPASATTFPSLPYTPGVPSPVLQGYDQPQPADYNDDGFIEPAVVRNNGVNTVWYISSIGNFAFGWPGDIPVPGYYAAAVSQNLGIYDPFLVGRDAIAVYRPSTHTTYIRSWNTAGTTYAIGWGLTGDVPVPGSYMIGDPTDPEDEVTMFRPSNGTAYNLIGLGSSNSLNTHTPIFSGPPFTGGFATAQTFAYHDAEHGVLCGVPGKCVGQEVLAIAIQNTNQVFTACLNSNPSQPVCQGDAYGAAGDIPFPYDWGQAHNGAGQELSGVETISVYRPSNNTWYIRKGLTDSVSFTQVWGQQGDYIVPGDYYPYVEGFQTQYGSPAASIAVYRPCDATWRILTADRSVFHFIQYGQPLGGC